MTAFKDRLDFDTYGKYIYKTSGTTATLFAS